ncbi:glutathione S-transferase [Nisaea denitrificans]|uniref:glutathione S-transferase n=1 Tax=Nisaea denitrificans TaxID=390877 RepID=UPI0003FA981B|nr:glutathione S-transferase [Nisaea denitrificans]
MTEGPAINGPETSGGPLPVLYSFRRCPYAMRARLALTVSQQDCVLREVVLRDKPAEMLKLSPKGTVPVLHLPHGQVLEQSLDIMRWTLARHDPEGWLNPETGSVAEMEALIGECDGTFKHHLDRYKYSVRYGPETDPLYHRGEGATFLNHLNERLKGQAHLFGNRPSLADFAIFPFVRQFANTGREWFDAQPLSDLQAWLSGHLNSDIFQSVMRRREGTDGAAAQRLLN